MPSRIGTFGSTSRSRPGFWLDPLLSMLWLLACLAAGPTLAQSAPAPEAGGAAPDKRGALVIGNSRYRAVAALPTPVPDADLVGAALRSTGIDVTIAHDLDRAGMIATLKAFRTKANDADWAVVYFAGHGMQLDGLNYFFGVDADPKSDRDVDGSGVSLNQFLAVIEGARKLRLIVLDACGENPFPQMGRENGLRMNIRGLARVEPEKATLVFYAAKADTTAMREGGSVSLFARSFARRITEPGLTIEEAFHRVRLDVLEATGTRQEPIVYGSLRTEFRFMPPK